MKINSEKLNHILGNVNDEFVTQHGYYFCRCYECVFSVLLNYLQRFSTVDNQSLGKIIQQINSDYLHSAGHHEYLGKSGLRCGHYCVRYEENLEAVPFLFWEVNKAHLKQVEELLQDSEFLDCFPT